MSTTVYVMYLTVVFATNVTPQSADTVAVFLILKLSLKFATAMPVSDLQSCALVLRRSPFYVLNGLTC